MGAAATTARPAVLAHRPQSSRPRRSPSARRRRSSSAYSAATSCGSSSRELGASTHGFDDRRPGDTARRGLAAEPRVDGRADVGELAVLVDAPGGVPALDVREQQGVLARVVGRRRRRVAAVVGGDDEQVVRPQRVEQVGQSAVEVLQAAMEVHRVVAVAPERVGLDEVREDQPVVDRRAGAPRSAGSPRRSTSSGTPRRCPGAAKMSPIFPTP